MSWLKRLRSSPAAGYVVEPAGDGLTLVVTGPWTTEAQDQLVKPEITGPVLNYARGFREGDLDFLQEWSVRELTVLARTVVDLAPVYRLAATLERVSVQTAPAATLDLRRLPLLGGVAAEWRQIADSVGEAASLTDLFAMSYDAADLLPLSRNQALTRVRLKQHPRLCSLDGLEKLPALSELAVLGAGALADVGALAAAECALTHLDLESCPRLTALDDLAGQQSLRTLGIGDCGDMASLRPISGLVHLESLWAWGSTRIRDGDLTPLLGLPALADLRMMHRAHYRPSLAHVKRELRLD